MNDRTQAVASAGVLMRPAPSAWQVSATQDVHYEVRQLDGLFDESNRGFLDACGAGPSVRRHVVVIDERVHALYGDQIRRYYDRHGVELQALVLPVTEEEKDLESAMSIVRHLEAHGVLRRSDPLIGIGGGVLLDLVGFAAGLYRRGIPYIKVPTNAMAIWDAAVGIKTAVNALGRRNRLGSYHAPSKALLDRRFLRTVERRHLSNGMGELLKLAVIKDARLFTLLERHSRMLLDTAFQDGAVAPEVISRAVDGMLEELAPNLWETMLERSVDFGHSFAPLLEMRALPELLHGEAVALDVLFSCRIAVGRGLMAVGELDRVAAVMRAMELPLHHRFFEDADMLQEALADTVRHRDGLQRLPMPSGIGDCVFINDLGIGEIRAAAEGMRDATY
ncbi:sedoheptulose 7-phosphate cyclase [Acidovorax sp. GBBC 3334]|uniref:sedoheptulose 7-phosphate cyclase n=1 Tax=Acidovorax sp. GBBC 3334 TaxID=2940496 RepID=UPI0023033D75|nr:sedoheptulose 7-phosphate cyclase [Acidovorax sp. GBBC 3334]MDA8453245.1 sedoheptulose 7-phosphate cyclase [Acidovorax sp. GBBC 3334]